jgi:hypothetical protein
MGDIKTKKRNRMAPQKPHDTAFLKLDIWREHAVDGMARKRVKCQFGYTSVSTDGDRSGSRIQDEEVVESSDPASDTGSDSDRDYDRRENHKGGRRTFHGITQSLVKDLEEDEKEDRMGVKGENPSTDFHRPVR